MLLVEKYFVKKWTDGSEVKISFKKENFKPIIVMNMIENSIYEKEMEEIEKQFRLKIFSEETINVLKEKGFSEHN